MRKMLRGLYLLAFGLILSAAQCGGPAGNQTDNTPPQVTQKPVASSCGSNAIECYDEFARVPVNLISFRPQSRWQKLHLTWKLVKPLDSLSTQSQIDVINQALGLWSAASTLTFEQTTGAADLNLSFSAGDHGDPFPFDGPADPARAHNFLGHAFLPGSQSPGETHFDAADHFAIDSPDGQTDLLTVMLHETGHALGLEHSLNTDAVMYPRYHGKLTLLATDDVTAIQKLYGSKDGSVQPVPDPTPGQLPPPPPAPSADDPDSDGDGIPDSLEVFALGSDPFKGDSNGDGASDFQQVFVAGSDPIAPVGGLINGSFEQGGPFVNTAQNFMTLPVGSTVITGWTVINAEIGWGKIPNNVTDVPPPDGSQFILDLTGFHDSPPYGGVTQTITTISGAGYTFTASVGAQQDIAAFKGPITITVAAGPTTFPITFDFTGTGAQWKTFSFNFTATDVTTVISILGTDSKGGAYIGLDNVSVRQIP